MSTITLQDLEKQYDDVSAVEGIDLEVEDGEFLVVVGPSGCGKSTTLRMIAGLEDVTAGTITISGEDVTARPPKDRDIAMVFQNYALYPHMTAAENMKFGMRSVSEYSDAEIDERVADAADTLDIADLLDRRPEALSGGERQRVAIGRALVREPSVFLLDEPLSNLDAKLRVQMRAELLKLHRELDATTVYVTHDQTEAMTLGDRVAVLNDGRLQQVASPQRLYDFPENRFVAGFIGEPAMNVVPVEVRERGGDVVADQGGFVQPLPNGNAAAELVGQQAAFGVRPEDVSLATNLPAGAATFRATVTVREPLGELLLLHCEVGGAELQVKVEPRSDIYSGDTVELGFDDQRLHLFDDTGDAVYHSATQPDPRQTVSPE
ncbi:ABC-type transport system ATP-binding protein (probable substrate glycerol-3-phosphate) [Halobacterium hubeiense]|jgi:multiple sugar transport system ATP-binding protein|uniref:ABC-type D-xylose/L-arabinose transporter n=1 Tax=Halobacterium hubeiense TaxID=1407499 RepID=A0A0U5CY39_9EURY|nr:ABC transporter ATP-binding protein [Halobacterium hubeiense]CQH56480.1 ABC-type transport system ATP-binding protein (probable substrate glycerol-3-phosphate) [Halobacterium hubeiense]